jgi:hypothetical protein
MKHPHGLQFDLQAMAERGRLRRQALPWTHRVLTSQRALPRDTCQTVYGSAAQMTAALAGSVGYSASLLVGVPA